MNGLKVVLFDVDGVLLDSLTPHLQICIDKNREYGLGLKIPSPAEFKRSVRSGVRISPMKYFFMAVGFPDKYAEKANQEYQEVFMRLYAPRPFPGAFQMLEALHEADLPLGIVTSNVRSNVVDALGPSINLFRPDCIFSKDSIAGSSKVESLHAAIASVHVQPAEALYVGDQPADWAAARTTGAKFLGVTYGWGISEEDHEFPVVTKVSEISQYILTRENEYTPEVGSVIAP